MITAKEARKLVEFKQAIDKKLEEFNAQLNDKIIERSKEGYNDCWLEYTDTDIIETVKKNMINLGYRVTVNGPYWNSSYHVYYVWRLGFEW